MLALMAGALVASGPARPAGASAAVDAFAVGTTRVSLLPNGVEPEFTNSSTAISADGRYVAFQAFPPFNDDGAEPGMYVHDRQTGQTTLELESGYGGSMAFSADGRYLAFSWEMDLPGDTNGRPDVYVRDRQTGQISRISVSSTGGQSNGYSQGASISADGRFVAFSSEARNLVAGDTNGVPDVFVRDRQTATTTRVSVSSSGAQGNRQSAWGQDISADGRYVVFASEASNLVPGDTNGAPDVFVRDLALGQTTRVSVGTGGTQLSFALGHAISADGRYVGFVAFLPGTLTSAVFVHDRVSGQTAQVSVGLAGAAPTAESYGPALSADGRFVAFSSEASNLVDGDTNQARDVFVADRTTGRITRASTATDGTQGNGDAWMEPAIAASGAAVAFASEASNLVPADTNDSTDVFVHEVGPASVPANVRGTADRAGTGVTLTWLDPQADGSTVTVERAVGEGAFASVGVTGFDATSWTDTSVARGTTYRYRLQAANAFGASDWSTAVTVAVPATPGSVPANGYHPLAAARLFDTRGGPKLAAGAVHQVKVTGVHGVPAGGVAAVSLNVTVTQPDAPGYLTVYGCGDRPYASSLNYLAGQTVPNAVITPVSADGYVCFYTMSPTHLLADVEGWYPTGGGFGSVTPARLLDTRDGTGGVPVGKLVSGGVVELDVTGSAGVPASGVAAVSLNVTVTEPDGPGYITVYACGERPLASNLNYVGRQTVPNAVIAPVSASGTVCLYTMTTTHLVADVNGWFATGSGFGAVTPYRVLDTRDGTGGVASAKVRADNVVMTKVTGRGGVPASGVAAVSLNVTVTQPDTAGYVTVYGCGPRPLASNLNFSSGQTVPNAVLAEVSADGYVCLYTMSPTHLVADVNGWFPAS